MTDVTKIVYNGCFGGFGLSNEAVREYLRRTGRTWTEEPLSDFSNTIVFKVDGENYWSPNYDIARTDPVLVAIVEEMGTKANGHFASLLIETLPKGTKYRITEYDGSEDVETIESIEWETA